MDNKHCVLTALGWYGMVDACFSGTDHLGSRCLNIVLLIYIELYWTCWSTYNIYIYIIILKLYIIYYHMFNWFFLHFILVSPAHRILRSFSGVDPSSSIHLRTLQEFHKNIWINLIISYNHSPTWNKVIGDVSSYYLLLTITLVTSQWRRYL